MSEKPAHSPPQGWDIPPPNQSGDVPWLAKIMSKLFLRSRGMWVARPDHPREKALIDLLNETCREMGIQKVPRLSIYASGKPNAAAMTFGSDIIFSTNLLDIMPRDQVKAVMGHELTHYSKQKGLILAVSFGAWLATDFIIWRTYRTINKPDPKTSVGRGLKSISRRPFLGTLLWEVADWSVFVAITAWFQRRFEKDADLGGAKVAGSDAMIGALETLDSRVKEIRAEDRKRGKINWQKYTIDLPIFRNHPTVPRRIANIVAHEPKSFAERQEQEKAQSAAAEQSPAK